MTPKPDGAHCNMSPWLPPVLLWVLVQLLGISQVQSKHLNTFAGPFIAFAHKFEVCPSDGTIVLQLRNSHFNPVRPHERQTISGNVTVREDVGDDFWSNVNLATRSNNQWKENAFILNFPNILCSAVREQAPDLFRVFQKYTKTPMDKKKPCIFPAGEYFLKNESVSWTFPNFPVIPYGRYKFRVTSRSKGAAGPVAMCAEVDCEAIPKP